ADQGSGAPVFSSMAVDLTITNLLPLFAGLPVHLRPEENAVEALAEAIRGKRDFGLIKITPTHLSLLTPLLSPDEARGAARTLVVGADFLPAEPTVFWQDHAPEVRLMNEYGPTETVVGCSAYLLPPGLHRHGPVPVGGPIQNLKFYVLDPRLQPLTVGLPGELFIGGAGVARGYLGRPGLTAEKFVPDPFTGGGARMYRTGDRARWLEGGNLLILGRTDSQVKVHGFRVELGEIEAALRRHDAVSGCVVVLREDVPGERRLVAYVVGDADADALRAFLRRSLPEHMIPAAFVRLDALPETPTGKIDPRTLPAPELGPVEERYVAPRNAVEETLAEIWAEVLGHERVGVEESFFELGGDSILSIQLVSRARRAGVHITPRQIFEHLTIARLAEAVCAQAPAQGPRAEQARVEGAVRPTPVQGWFFEQGHAVPAHENQSVLLAVDGAVSDAVLEAALGAVLERHDALRLRFRRTESGWEQWHAAEVGFSMERLDLADLPADGQDRAQAEGAGRMQAGLDLEQGPVGRALLVNRGAGGRVLLLVLHHLVVDGVSWRILQDDLEHACAQAERGEPIDLGPKSTSFRQWAEALQAYAASDALRDEAAHWLAQGPEGVAPLPADGAGGRTVASARTVSVGLDAEETRALLQEVPAAYRTQINDVLLCALAEAVSGWTGSPRVRLALEGHGREEEVVPGVDLTRTVGWFTTVYPVVLDLAGAAGPGDRLKRVKEQLRAIPRRGIGYGVLRYLGTDGELRRALAAQAEPEISFNYLGQFDSGPVSAARLRYADGPRGPESADANTRGFTLEVNGGIRGGCLRLDWNYDEGTHHRATIERVAQAYADALRGLIAHCRQAGAGGFTPSDFPLAELAQEELDALLAGRGGVEDLYPLSPMQEGMLFHALRGDASQAYQVEVAQRIEGVLDAGLFRRAWAEVVSRHAVLRTAFAWEGLRRPLQRVQAAVEVPWVVEDWSGLSAREQEAALDRFLAEDRARGFALDQAPLLRFALFRTGERAHWFVRSQHHLLTDGWTADHLAGEVFRLYGAWSAGRTVELRRPRPYRDYIAWLAAQDADAAERYWTRVLAGFTAPTALGVDRPAGAESAGERGHRAVRVPAALTQRLEETARREQVTLNTVVQAAWGVLLSRYGGEDDVVFGATVSGRPGELEGVEEMVGLFINTLPVRMRVRGSAQVGALLRELQASQAEAREYDYAPLVQVQGWSEVPRGTPLFETHFIFESYPAARGGGSAGDQAALRVTGARTVEWNTYPLSLMVIPGPEIVLDLSYDEGRFESAAAERMLEHLGRLLEQVAENPERPVAGLTLLDGAERARVVEEWNRTDAAYPADRCIHQLFQAQAARTPDAAAVVFGDASLSYRELDARANRIAHHLAGLGVGPEVRVGLCLERGLDLLPALLGVIKAGGAYVPVDPAHPAERIGYVLEDSAAAVLLTQASLRESIPVGPEVRVVCVDAEGERIAAESAEPPVTAVTAENLAYVIYTSGSTGRPKGVAMHHRGVCNYIDWGVRAYGADQGSGAPVFSSMAVDLTITNLLPLFAGLPVHLLPEENAVEALAEAIRGKRDFGLIKITPTHLSLLTPLLTPEEARGAARTLVVGADFLPAEPTVFWQDHAPEVRLMNEYGPTETVVGGSAYLLPPGVHRHGPVPVGGPIQNLRFYVLDAYGEPVPVGLPGELYIGGAGVARGYLGRPGLSAEKFVPDPFAGGGARMYRTGDRARWLEGGNLMILGRTDSQVKVRGYRVELGEIEAALRRHDAVSGCLVVLREDVPGERRLVAYVVGNAGTDALREHLRQSLPEHMVPEAFVPLDTLPRTTTGKIDPRTLPAPELASAEERYVAPRTPVEESLAEIWAEVLDVPRAGAADDFFALGGHSLRVMRLVSAVR
ncbi:MAG TPA: amino acid adenylation domain-containing protein, partial [Longimicrobium sp.]|nr:amino acid adenylation domain-containing protein [Longimicrobium sp.]